MYNIVIFPIIIFFFSTSTFTNSSHLLPDENKVEVYLIKQYWHTAIVIESNEIDKNKYRFMKFFEGYNLLDFGWGDELFYQHPDFDLYLGARAILKPTSSTLRVEGISLSKQDYFDYSEIVIKLLIDSNRLEKILDYIEATFYKIDDEYVVLNSLGGSITFFKAKGEYHLFNTCNTWLARCLKQAGFDIDTNIILTEQLFSEILKYGELIKKN